MSSLKRLFSLVFVRTRGKILLGYKKRGFGRGKWNGFGGKIEKGETIYDGAIRELKEECGLTATELQKVGILSFAFEGESDLLEVHVFETYKYSGEIIETDEMRPMWCKLQNIPFRSMWPDDSIWFPHMFKGEKFEAYFLYRGQDEILNYNIQMVEELP